MPTYTFKNKRSGKEHTDMMKISEMEEYIKQHPNMQLVPASPLIVTGVASGKNKPDKDFRDLLSKIKKKHIRSNMNTW